MERCDGIPVQIESVLEGVDVVNDHSSGSPAARQVTQELGIGVGSGDLPLIDYTLHGSNGEVGKYDGAGLDERLKKDNEGRELRKGDVIVVEGAQKKNVLSGDSILETEAPKFDAIRAVRKLPPRGGEINESIGRRRCKTFSECFHFWRCENHKALYVPLHEVIRPSFGNVKLSILLLSGDGYWGDCLR